MASTIPRYFDQELNGLKQKLLVMATTAEEAVQKSLTSVTTRNSDLARDVITDDARLNNAELEIEEQAFRLLALRQPVAADLRLIIATMRIATTLERIGDQGVNIAERALELNNAPPVDIVHRHQKAGRPDPGHGAHQHRRLRPAGPQTRHAGVRPG